MKRMLPKELQFTLPTSLQEQWSALEACHTQLPVHSIRKNPYKFTTAFEANEPVPWCSNAYYLTERPLYTADPLFHAGTYYVQEASSMFLEQAIRQCLDISKPQFVLDLCAAPGGKTTLIASLLNKESLLVSNEVIQSRASILKENCVKWGMPHVLIANNDPSHFSKLPHSFSALLIDAPCSGSGLFRKKNEYIDDWNESLVHLCAERQKRILHDSYHTLAQDGLLVYMTCSLSQEENEDMVDYLMSHFALENLSLKIPSEWNIHHSISNTGASSYRLMPHVLKGEGFFIACFRKKDGKAIQTPFAKVAKPNVNFNADLFYSSKDYETFLFQDMLKIVPYNMMPIVEAYKAKLKIIHSGIQIGKWQKQELIPSHDLAMFAYINYEKKISVNLNTALRYLKKETIEIESAEKGWFLITYNDIPLGWIKHLGNRINNYYPTNYRIVSKNILTS
ncbi:MAG: Fmu (Sun) domain protein [Chitinophagaceae bacterium]